LEEQKPRARRAWLQGVVQGTHEVKDRVAHTVVVAVDPRRWDRKLIWQNAVLTPVSCLPSVAVGLLLNILDALSYGEKDMFRSYYNTQD
jgi:SulP family sulfate permease